MNITPNVVKHPKILPPIQILVALSSGATTFIFIEAGTPGLISASNLSLKPRADGHLLCLKLKCQRKIGRGVQQHQGSASTPLQTSPVQRFMRPWEGRGTVLWGRRGPTKMVLTNFGQGPPKYERLVMVEGGTIPQWGTTNKKEKRGWRITWHRSPTKLSCSWTGRRGGREGWAGVVERGRTYLLFWGRIRPLDKSLVPYLIFL